MHTETTRTHARHPARRAGTFIAAVALAAGTGLLAAPAAAQTGAEVLLTDMNRFEPEQVSVDEGDTVDFRWEGGQTHNVIFEDGPRSENTDEEGVNFSRTFDEAGEFGFQCTFHPGTMNGSVTVAAAEADTPDPEPQPQPEADTDTDTDTDTDDQVDEAPSAEPSQQESVPQPSRVDAGTAGERAGLSTWTTLAVVLGMFGLAVPVALAAARRR